MNPFTTMFHPPLSSSCLRTFVVNSLFRRTGEGFTTKTRRHEGKRGRGRWKGFLVVFCAFVVVGCGRKSGGGSKTPSGPVVLYTSVDEPYARSLVERFTRETGIDVTLVTDSEASKSVGLVEKLRAEKDDVRADVWWGNECFLTIGLADEGVLTAYDSPAAADIPAPYKDPAHRWAGAVLRVRTLVSKPAADGRPPAARMNDFLRPPLRGRIALARPTAGTTGGHVAALYVAWGKDRADAFFRGLHDNQVTLVGGNSVVAESVARGDFGLGVCDNDDAADAAANVGPLDAVLPDQAPGESGTLAMPCAVGLVAGGPHPAAAKRLIDFLLSASVAQSLVDQKFAWCPTRDATGKGKFMAVDYTAVAHAMPAAIRSATAIMEGR